MGKHAVSLDLEKRIEKLVRAYDEWLADDIDDAELIDEVGEFCRIQQHGDGGERSA